MKLITVLTATAALAAGALLAGCGGGGDDNSTTAASTDTSGQTITKADFLQQGNQICKEANDQLNQQPQPNQNSSQAEVDDFVTNTVVPNVQNQLDQIKALGAPAGDEDQVNKILGDAQAALDKLKSDPSSISGDSFAQANQEANAYGLTECGKGGG
jgi:hypothetical protein